MKLTRRHMLGVTGGIFGTSRPGLAQTPMITDVTERRKATMDIKRNGSTPVRQRARGLFHRHGSRGPGVSGRRTGARQRRSRHLRAGRALGMAHSSARPDADRHIRPGLGADRGRTDRRNPTRRCRVVSARREALAWRDADDRDGAYRHYRNRSTARTSIGWKRSATRNTEADQTVCSLFLLPRSKFGTCFALAVAAPRRKDKSVPVET